MKRVIITILIFLFGIGCGFGAFFMLKTGGNMKKEELKSVQRLEVPETETKAYKQLFASFCFELLTVDFYNCVHFLYIMYKLAPSGGL